MLYHWCSSPISAQNFSPSCSGFRFLISQCFWFSHFSVPISFSFRPFAFPIFSPPPLLLCKKSLLGTFPSIFFPDIMLNRSSLSYITILDNFIMCKYCFSLLFIFAQFTNFTDVSIFFLDFEYIYISHIFSHLPNCACVFVITWVCLCQ